MQLVRIRLKVAMLHLIDGGVVKGVGGEGRGFGFDEGSLGGGGSLSSEGGVWVVAEGGL